MKKKWIKSIIVIIIMIVSSIIICKKFLIQSVQTSNIPEEILIKEPIQWHANYIWDATTQNNQWMCFRKKVNLTQSQIKDVTAQIAVDSKYWLYINGEMVIREGGLKRGETMHSIYYDEVDITHYLKEGENTQIITL